MKTLLLSLLITALSIFGASTTKAETFRSAAASIVGNSAGCFNDGNQAGIGDFTAGEADEIDRAIPCSNIVIDGIDGTPGGGSLNDFNAGNNARHIIYAELVRRQQQELACKQTALQSLAKSTGADHDQLMDQAMSALLPLIPEIMRLKREAARLDTTAQQACPYAGEGASGCYSGYDQMSLQQTEKIRHLLTRVPFGYEPAVQSALIRLASSIPANLPIQPKNDQERQQLLQAARLFDTAYSNSLIGAAGMYHSAHEKLSGLYVPMVKMPNGRLVGGEINEDDKLWQTFGEAGSFEGFANDLRVSTNTRREISCSLNATYVGGENILKAADYTINAAGTGAAIVTVVFPPSAVVTAPIIAFSTAYQAAGAVYYVDQAVRECSSPSTQYTVLSGNQCTSGNAFAAQAVNLSHHSTCAREMGTAAMSVGGIGFSIFSEARAARSTLAAADRASNVLDEVHAPPTDTQSLGARLGQSDRFAFYNATTGRQPIGPTTLVPGKTYTTVERGNVIVLGEDFVENGSRNGTHLRLHKAASSDFQVSPVSYMDPKFTLRGGTVRVNPDGSVDVSGYHNSGTSEEQIRIATENLAQAFRSAGVRVRTVTVDRLSPPGTPDVAP